MRIRTAPTLVFTLMSILHTSSFAAEFRACTNVPATGVQCRGEDYSCGQGCVKCGTVNVGAPSGQTIVSVEGSLSHAWSAWEQSPSLSGNSASGRAKNWSHNQPAQACVLLRPPEIRVGLRLIRSSARQARRSEMVGTDRMCSTRARRRAGRE